MCGELWRLGVKGVWLGGDKADKCVQVPCVAVGAAIQCNVCGAPCVCMVKFFELGAACGGRGDDWIFDFEGLQGW